MHKPQLALTEPAWSHRRWAPLRAAALVAGFAWVFTRPARLLDGDSYLHLAIARLMSEHGFVGALPWTRFSALGEHYGDKELLFHIGLIPFVRLTAPEYGGKLALALLCAALAWTLWELGQRALGTRGAIVPLLVFGASGSFVLRVVRLRPELASLLLFLWVVWALANRRYVLGALLAFAFTLSHTAFHSLLGLVFLYVCQLRWSERRWHWQPLASVGAGVALGVLAHPRFPDDLRIFWLQNVAFFRYRDVLDVGGEFQPLGFSKLLQLDGLCLLGLLVLVLAREPDPDQVDASREVARRMARLCQGGALAFGVLFLQMGRFATLAVPFAVLALVFELRALGLRVGERVRLGGHHTLPLSAALGAVGGLALLNGAGTAWANWQLARSFDVTLGTELEALAQHLPAGARVAANWDDAELYAFYAPHARFLNLFDPVFMAVPQPQRYATLQRILRGDEPDVPSAVLEQLDSEYLAFDARAHEALLERLVNDPRAQLVQRGSHALFRLAAQHPSFVSGWTRRSGSAPALTKAYVDVSAALDASGCASVEHAFTIEPVEQRWHAFELAAWGPSVLWFDGVQRLQLAAANEARLGQGPALALQLTPGAHTLRVRSCRHEGGAGFYLIDRTP